MTASEISNIKKIIKEIRNKLYEVEKLIDKNPKNMTHFHPNKATVPPSRKRNPYRSAEQ